MKLELKLFIICFGILVMVMFILPFFSAETYSISKNTTSQLGAQKTRNAWMMNLCFALMGISSVLAGWKHYEGFWFQRIALLVFGCSLLLAAIFRHAPIDLTLAYSAREDKLHSAFSASTGFAFTLLALSNTLIKEEKIDWILPIAAGIIASGFSALMFTVKDFMGIWQRLIFICSFSWMIYEFSKPLRIAK